MSFNHLLFLFFLICFSYQKDYSTFSNYYQIVQTKIESNYKIDFDKEIIIGTLKLYLKALMDGEVIVLDTNKLTIHSIIDSDTGDEVEFKFDYLHSLDALGTPLKIYKEYDKGDEIALVIRYETSKECSAVQWLSKEHTSGKEYPFMFTQCESILSRQLLPCQDTPSVKAPVYTSITVPKPLYAVNSGLYRNSIDNGNTTTFYFDQKIPIPTYLISFAAGAIEERKISDRTKVYAEKEIVDKAASEFSETENFLQAIESYISPYEWGEYNILVLPPSFPFGGMENPTLTFVTPALIVGDKSLCNVISHEISHSWSGNLVTNSNWSNFWLNEGFTVFLQRKITQLVYSDDMSKLEALLGYEAMDTDIKLYGATNDLTSMSPLLIGVNPDETYNRIPYEKGFNLIYYLENLVNDNLEYDLFQVILRKYFDKFKYKSVEYEDFRKVFEDVVTDKLGEEKAKEIFDKIDWDNWVLAPGYPKTKNDFSNKFSKEIEAYVGLFKTGKLPSEFKTTFIDWHTNQKLYFLSEIDEGIVDSQLGDSQYEYLNTTLILQKGYNAEVNFFFFKIMLDAKREDNIDELSEFLGAYGRVTYLRPLYSGLAKFDKRKATEIFEKNKSKYHRLTIELIEQLLKNYH